MKLAFRLSAGSVLLYSVLPAVAQEAAIRNPTAPATCASCPPPPPPIYVKIEGDPTLLVAALIVVSIVSATAGFLVGRATRIAQ